MLHCVITIISNILRVNSSSHKWISSAEKGLLICSIFLHPLLKPFEIQFKGIVPLLLREIKIFTSPMSSNSYSFCYLHTSVLCLIKRRNHILTAKKTILLSVSTINGVQEVRAWQKNKTSIGFSETTVFYSFFSMKYFCFLMS